MSEKENKNSFTVLLDGDKDITQHVPFPIKWGNMLDETLDTTRLSLKQFDKNIIHPLTPLQVTMTDKKGKTITLDTVVTTDEAAEIPVGQGKYNHEITCLEETKILEGIVVDALTFTNDLGRNYTSNNIWVVPYCTDSDMNVHLFAYRFVKNPSSIGTIECPPIDQIYMGAINGGWYSIQVRKNGVAINENSDVWENQQILNGTEVKGYSFYADVGKYEIKYHYSYGNSPNFDLIYNFYVVENYDPLPRWNIATVIDRVLDLAEPHLEGVAPRFALNGTPKNGEAASGQYSEFEKIESPEFAFTNCTLKEVLDQIGGYIHGVPRLKGNTIYYDMLGGTEQAKIADPKYAYISNMYSQDVENYCSALDSTVDNMVCLTDRSQGSITEPYKYGYKTLRTESVYARIEEGNMIIATQYPIQEIIGVSCGYIPGTTTMGGNITPYIFESAEYERMSSYSETYPDSKAFALYYTQGKRNIYGLGLKSDGVSYAFFKNYAIVNILQYTTHNFNLKIADYQKLAFQVSYIPVFSARTQQTKQYIGEFKQPRTLIYNQGANLVETRYYGENIKGAVARMGNVDRVVTYNLSDFSLIPEIGQMFGDDYYIAGVTCELYPEYVKCMLTLSQDFNRLSQYIGIDSVQRFYEVSEKQAYRRDIKYADYFVIGDKVEHDETLAPPDILIHGMETNAQLQDISLAAIQGRDEQYAPVGENVCLPVVSTAQGNAMVFTFNFKDNYGAGEMVKHKSESEVNGYFPEAVPYADYYGRMHYLQFDLYSRFQTPSYEGQQSNIGMALPMFNKDWQTGMYPHQSVMGGNLVVRKDGAEMLSVNYVLEFVSNRKNLIIGSGFARNMSLVSGKTRTAPAIYLLNYKIGKFDDKINLAIGHAAKVYDIKASMYTLEHVTYDYESQSLKFDDFIADWTSEAWALANSDGELYFGSNEPIKAGQTVSMPYITLRHDIFNLGGTNK